MAEEELSIREQMRKDIIMGVDYNMKQLMEIVKPVNFTSNLSRKGCDQKWLESGGMVKMMAKLQDIINGIEYLRDFR